MGSRMRPLLFVLLPSLLTLLLKIKIILCETQRETNNKKNVYVRKHISTTVTYWEKLPPQTSGPSNKLNF